MINFSHYRMFICGVIKNKSLTRHNAELGYFYEAVFEDVYGNKIEMKYAVLCYISVGYKHLLRRFKIVNIGKKKTLILDKHSIYYRYNKLFIIGKKLEIIY